MTYKYLNVGNVANIDTKKTMENAKHYELYSDSLVWY